MKTTIISNLIELLKEFEDKDFQVKRIFEKISELNLGPDDLEYLEMALFGIFTLIDRNDVVPSEKP